MSKTRFPHLQDSNAFPGNDGKPYAQYPNNFEYDRWGVGTKLTVCRVPWDLDKNVVDWQSSDAIVNYFHSLDSSSSFKLESELNREPDGSIRLPIPISNLKRYNYLFVEYTIPTTAEQPLDYADGSRQPFIGFFMSDFTYVAPNTTEAALATDWWTTSITSMEIQNMMLERGHAPMAATKVEDYLQDPIYHNQYLLTSDVSYAEPCITTCAQFESWMATTEPLMVLAVKATLEQAQAMLAEKQVDGRNTPPTFTDSPDRWGKQYDVQGYSWAGVSPFKDAEVESTPWSTATGLPAGVSMIAVKATDAQAFLEYCQKNSPELFEVVQSCFLIPGSLVASKEAGTFGGVQLFELKPLEELPPVPVKLEKEDFAYPAEYAEIAKLYTFPYAGLTFSDNDGHSVDVKIEYTSSVQIHRRVSLAYPYLRAQAFLSGVNGTGDTSYEWVDANGLKKTGSMPQADWTQTLIEYNIPTYALAQTAISQALLKNSTPAAIERLKALTAYQNGARSLNTSTENTRDSLATSLKNTLRSNETALENGTRSNETGNTNTLASLTTGNTNALASNKLALDNGTRSNDTSNTNTIASIENSATNTSASIATTRHNGLNSNETGYKNALASADTALSNEQASAATALSNTTSSAGTAYQNAENSATTAYQNAKNSADTGLANALSSNTTGYNNTIASAATAKSNADRSADASVTATANSNTTNEEMVTLTNNYSTSTNTLAKGFADSNFENRMKKMRTTIGNEEASDITKIFPNWNVNEFPSPAALQNALFDAMASLNLDEATRIVNMIVLDDDAIRNLSPTTGGTSSNMLLAKGTLQGAAAAISSGWSKFKNLTELGLSAVTSVASAVGGAVGGPVGGGETAAVSSGATEAVGGDTSSGINAQRAVVNPAIDAIETIAPTMISVTGEQAVFKNQSAINTNLMAASIYSNQRGVAVAEKLDGAQLTLTKGNMDSGLKLSNQLNVDKNSKQRDLATKQTALSAGTSKANAAASQATANANALASKKNADSNANNSYSTTMTNTENSKSTALTNAKNLQNRTVENANASNTTTLANAKRSNDLAHANADRSYKTTIANIESTYKTNEFINAANKKTSSDNQARSYTTTKANLSASKTVADANANRSYNTGTENQGRSYTTTSTNLAASKTTADANANDSNSTAVANAGYSQDTGLLNAQAELKLKQDAYQMSIENAKTNAPITVGSTSGDPLPDLWGQRGVEIRVKTQPLGAIASAGSEMLRYGYQLGQAWHFTGWSVMKHFSYWKASDLWLTPKSSFAELGKAAIRGIIESGVTVWRNPAEIGTVSVTENWED